MDCILIINKVMSKENATIGKDILPIDNMLYRIQMTKKSINSAVKALLFTENTKNIDLDFYGLWWWSTSHYVSAPYSYSQSSQYQIFFSTL